MKSNRMRLYHKPLIGKEDRLDPKAIFGNSGASVQIELLPPPLPISRISPDQLVEDVLVATLERLQRNSSMAVTAAAARYLTLLREKAL